MLLSKNERKLQKKGLDNMSKDELIVWIEVCRRQENTTKFNKARRTWKNEREIAEKILQKIGE